MHCSSSSTRPSKSIPGFYCPSARLETPFLCTNFLHSPPNAPPTPFNLRLHNSLKLELRPKLLPVNASKTDPSQGSDGEDAQGPPFLTILAGILVFFAIFWVIGSIVMWLISLFVHSPPSK